MLRAISHYRVPALLIAAILAVFLLHTMLAASYQVPRLFDLFDTLIVAGSLAVWMRGYRRLRRSDWLASITLGAVVSGGMLFATLFTPYPFLGIVRDNPGHALVRGICTVLAALGGLVIARQGGPVPFHAANAQWRQSGRNFLFGLLIGLPLAALNVLALRFTQGQPLSWQDPSAALLDGLQPGIVEEVIYRLAFLGLLWLVLRKPLPDNAAWLSGVLAMLVHNFAHLDDLFLQAPLTALGMGLAMAVIWGLPLTFLALRRGLESAVAFHWIQDVARFTAGF